jgi:hypothetical protein
MTVDYESPKAATNNLSLLNDSVSKKPPCIPDMSKMSLNDNEFKNPQNPLILNKKTKNKPKNLIIMTPNKSDYGDSSSETPDDRRKKNFVCGIDLDLDKNLHLIQTPNPMDPSNPFRPLNNCVIFIFQQLALNAKLII